MAGTVTRTTQDLDRRRQAIRLAWTSTSGGDVSAHSFTPKRGRLVQVKFVPGASSVQPSADYDVTLVDSDGADLLQGEGADLSNSAASFVTFATPVQLPGGAIDLVVANAGNAKQGTVVLWVE